MDTKSTMEPGWSRVCVRINRLIVRKRGWLGNDLNTRRVTAAAAVRLYNIISYAVDIVAVSDPPTVDAISLY